ncbi:MAG: peptide transporter substrate-binding protein, partial [Rhizobacter sp.]|nr:peptide transporter substrate-binding protein [Rhizobacter sp.]
MKLASIVASLVLGACLISPAAHAQDKTLRLIPHANLTTLDPIFTTAFITRNHGYMIYDTLFGTDTKGAIKPQMVDSWKVAPDSLSWTFVLRDGLEFSDGKPVTSDDVIASLKRWSARDSLGLLLAKSLDAYVADNARTFTIKLKQPFGVMLEALGKPSSNTPFIMPASVAATPATEQIKSFIGSGPYIFVSEEFKPGESATYVKNTKYKPRSEAPDGTTGGKVVKVDKVTWVFIRDPQTQYNALLAGEVDLMEMPTFEQIATLKAEKEIKLVDATPDGYQNEFRFNHTQPPFNDVRVRRAAMLALGQEAILKVQVGDPAEYKVCRSMYPCGSVYSNNTTGDY